MNNVLGFHSTPFVSHESFQGHFRAASSFFQGKINEFIVIKTSNSFILGGKKQGMKGRKEREREGEKRKGNIRFRIKSTKKCYVTFHRV